MKVINIKPLVQTTQRQTNPGNERGAPLSYTHPLSLIPPFSIHTRHDPKVLVKRASTQVLIEEKEIKPDGKVKKHWKRVPKAEAHPQKVLEVLQAG